MSREQSVQVQEGHGVNMGDGGRIGQVGNNTNYHISSANLILPPEFIQLFHAAYEQRDREDFTLEEIPRESWEPETCFVPGGIFLMGSEAGDDIPPSESPQFEYFLPDFRVGKYPVTNRQYAHYLLATNGDVPTELAWQNGIQPAENQLDLPVRGITWKEAIKYCNWLIEVTGRPYALPSEAQWEKAARGPEGHNYPWGNDWQEGTFCNSSVAMVTPVNAYPGGASVYGCEDMVGNVREWTTSMWGRKRRHNLDPLSAYPWQEIWKPNGGHDELNQNRQIRRVTRGGAKLVSDVPLRAANRDSELPFMRGLKHRRIGFRVVINWE
ncbi:MAG: SUMF1/EgtB/PvdO family nonheme iron enzyme [Anaerolineaceae bacterium]|nr:SUMF1/EgtB/PvdO family nonheme iron enzyme [Anaerolineaceae bacterium]